MKHILSRVCLPIEENNSTYLFRNSIVENVDALKCVVFNRNVAGQQSEKFQTDRVIRHLADNYNKIR